MSTTDTRFIVRDGLGAADDGSGPPAEWWVYRQWLAGVSEYAPGFPVLDEDWRDDDSFLPILFRVEADAIAMLVQLGQRIDR